MEHTANMEELNVVKQQQQHEKTQDFQKAIEIANLENERKNGENENKKNENENNEYAEMSKGKSSQSTDASENCAKENSAIATTATTQLKTIKLPNDTNATTATKVAGGGEPMSNVTAPKPAATDVTVAKSNEETEKAAMVDADAAKMSTATPKNINNTTNTNTNKATMMPTATTTTLMPTATAIVIDELKTQAIQTFEEFAVPAIPPTNAGNGDALAGAAGTGAKKRRNNKSARKRDEKETRNTGTTNKLNSPNKYSCHIGATNGGARRSLLMNENVTTNATAGAQPNNGSVTGGTAAASMKTSVSMTSLPPDDEKSESRDVIKAKLRVERPYNSLKKNVERNVINSALAAKANCFSQSQSSTSSFANNRYSWGSGYSYSSSSLQSSATQGLGSAKDDLWAAIQTNYNYIMDTNLLDSCKEAERHLAEQSEGVDGEQSPCCLKLLGVTQRREMLWHDPEELRKWLREMEERLELAPTLSAATALTTAELQRCLAEHSVLYHEIVSHARVVSACIRTATEQLQGQVQLQQQLDRDEDEEEQQLQSIDSCCTTVPEQSNLSLTSSEADEKTTDKIPAEKASDELNSNNKSNNNNNSNDTSSRSNSSSSNTSTSGIETTEKSLQSSPKKSTDQQQHQERQQTSKSQLIEDSLERLQNRYHLLYLKAFEVQLWLDGLLRKKGSNTSIADDVDYIVDDINIECNSSECEEDETAATEDDLHILGLDSDLTHNSSSVCPDLVAEVDCDVTKGGRYCEDGDDEGDEEDEGDEDEVDFGRRRIGWPGRGYSGVLVTFDKRGGNREHSARAATLTDFEADSESSDWETTQQHLRIQRKAAYPVSWDSTKQQLLMEHEAISINSNDPALIGKESANHNGIGESSDIHTSAVASRRYQQQDDLVADNLGIAEQRAFEMSTKPKKNDLLQPNGKPELLIPIDSNGNSAANASNNNNTNSNSNCIENSNANTISTATQTHHHQQQQQLQQQKKLHILNTNNKQQVAAANSSTPILKQKSIAVISPNSHNNNKSPTVLRKRQQHQHQHQHTPHNHIDISKFNRSNRKSKNCAVFYFKHLDTDNETNCSSVGDAADLMAAAQAEAFLSSSASQTSEHQHLLKSADASSDDDGGWLYSSHLPATHVNEVVVVTDECVANKGTNNSNNNNHNCITTIVIDGVQSSAVSSSNSSGNTAIAKTTTTTTTVIGRCSDDSDKENKEAHVEVGAATTPQPTFISVEASSQIRTQIAYNERQLSSALAQQLPSGGSASASASPSSPSSSSSLARFGATKKNCSGGSGSSSYSTRSSSCCSSNDLLTETTTSATTTTQITQMHFQRMQRNGDNDGMHEVQFVVDGGRFGSVNCNKSQKMRIDNNNGANGDADRAEAAVAGNGGVIICNSRNNHNNNTNSIEIDNCNNNKKNNNNNNNNNNNSNGSSSSANSNASNNSYAALMHHKQQQQLDILNGNMEKIERPSTLRCHPKHIIALANKNSRKHQHLPQIDARKGLFLPPRSPNKPTITLPSPTEGDNVNAVDVTTKNKLSQESIKQLVLEAEHLVRDAEALKTPIKSKQKYSCVKLSSTVKKREVIMPGPIKQRVQEWLEHQPSTPTQLQRNHSDELHHSAAGKTGDDCEASGEASETDSMPQPGSDTSEGLTESIATCMQTSTNSYGGNSTECFGGSAEPILSPTTVLGYGSSNQSLNMKIVKRAQTRRKSDRPWSVSCLSQLTTETVHTAKAVATVSNVQTGLATHSISESALDSLSPGGRQRASSSSTTQVTQVKPGHSKSSLKRRKTRKKKMSSSANIALLSGQSLSAGMKTPETGSEDTAEVQPRLTQTLLMKSCESMTANQIREITNALLSLQRGNGGGAVSGGGEGAASVGVSGSSNVQHTFAQSQQQYMVHQKQQQQLQQQQQQQQQQYNDSGEEAQQQLMKPNFRVGSYTTAYMRNEKRLGSLAALATYTNEDEEEQEQGAATPTPQKQRAYTTGTEDHHSSFSETAWDNYQEKYNSENYSEGFDSDAARKLMEFGDDYRNFIDSQSDCCSSLSAANNLDSLSPPRMDSLPQTENTKSAITQGTIANSVDHARRRRALDLEYERRRKTLEIRRKSCQESTDTQHTRSPTMSLSSSANAITPKIAIEKLTNQQIRAAESASRKLDFGGMSHSAQSLRRTSESDTSTRRRKLDERRRSSRNLDKTIKLIPANTSSSSCDDSSDDEKEVRNLLQQNRNRLEDTQALKIRCHLLRPEDYTEIINTCRDNIRCLEAVLRSPPGTMLSAQCAGQTKDLLAAWEDLLGWSENAAAARKMQEEMIMMKHSLNKFGNKGTFELLDTEPQIQIAIEALKNEKTELQTYRTNMLRLNASVHSWLTRQERRLQNALAEEELKEAAEKVNAELIDLQSKCIEVKEGEAVIESITTIEQLQEKTFETMSTATTTSSSVASQNVTIGVATVTTSIATGASTSTGTSTSTSVSTSTAAKNNTKVIDLHTLINAENEFHKHLKNEVSDMYSAWDDADARINTQLETLTNSLIAWRQLECGLYEFQQALGQDRGTLKGLEGALDKGQATPVELAQNVKVVAKLLSERVNVSQEQLTAVQEHLDPNHILHITKFTASNGSLSDSGISDGGATSDGGLSERERRLGVLRRLVKQLELALAPGSEAMKSIAVRMESAEAELKNLQNTCRDLIVRTAATHQSKKNQQQQQQQLQLTEALLHLPAVGEEVVDSSSETYKVRANGDAGGGGKTSVHGGASPKRHSATTSKGNRRRKPNRNNNNAHNNSNNSEHDDEATADDKQKIIALTAGAPDSGDPADDPDLEFDLDDGNKKDDKSPQNGWAWRIAKAAVPMQLALITFFCAACLMQPNCCDNLNNLSMSFTPQLRYIRGPPPI